MEASASPLSGQPPGDERDVRHESQLELAWTLSRKLKRSGIHYCRLPADNFRSAPAVGAIDLLVAQPHLPRLLALLVEVGFKEARLANGGGRPSIRSFFGLDERSGLLIQVRATDELLLNNGLRLPIEDVCLDSAVAGPLFVEPSPDCHLVLFVMRLALHQARWPGLARRLAPWDERWLSILKEGADPRTVRKIVETHLPIGTQWLWWRYSSILQRRASRLAQSIVAVRLIYALAAAMSRVTAPASAPLGSRPARALARFFKSRVRMRLVRGGAVIAVVGGDGAGKTTAVAALAEWLGGPFPVHILHLGKPHRSFYGVVIKAFVALLRGARAVAPSLAFTLPKAYRARRPVSRLCLAAVAGSHGTRPAPRVSSRPPPRRARRSCGLRSVPDASHNAHGRVADAMDRTGWPRHHGEGTRRQGARILRQDIFSRPTYCPTRRSGDRRGA